MLPKDIQEKLEIYHGLLLQWQKTINLVSPKTLDNAWSRHFEDSLQIVDFIPQETKTLWDLGSGAGFPGLVVAVARPEISVNLIESDARKAAFLQTVSRETRVGSVHVRNDRLEDILDILPPPEVMTARAFAPLEKILEVTKPVWLANPDLLFILPKGKNVAHEIAEAHKKYDFECVKKQSAIDKDSCILSVSKINLL